MARRKFHRHRIFNLAVGKNSVEKTIAESIDGALNAGALDKIDTSTNHAHLELPSRRGQRDPPLTLIRDICHCSEHFFHGSIKPNPNGPRYDGVTNVELGQTRNLVDKLDIFVVDAVAGVDLKI